MVELSALLDIYLDQFLLFVLVLTRISGLVMTAPIYGARTIPARIRAFIAVGLALMITPLQSADTLQVPQHLVGGMLLLARELILGLALGIAVMILVSGLQLTGQLVGQVSGMALADVFDPTFQTNVPIFTQMLDVIAMSVFLAVGGHRRVLRALLDTFHWRPPGIDDLPLGVVDTLVAVTGESFIVGIRAGAPVLVSLMLAVLILGLLNRTLPQLNVLAVGFSLNAFVLLTSLAFSIGSIAWLLEERTAAVVDSVHEVLITE